VDIGVLAGSRATVFCCSTIGALNFLALIKQHARPIELIPELPKGWRQCGSRS